MSSQPTPFTIPGARIEAARKEKGLSQTELALALRKWLVENISQTAPPEYKDRILRVASQASVSRWERGERIPKGDMLGGLTAILGIDAKYILNLPTAQDGARNHPETVEADEIARIIDDMSPRLRKVALSVIKALAQI